MFFLMIISLFCFLTSVLVQFLILFKVDIPRSELATTLNAVMVIVVLARVFSTKRLRIGNNWFWDINIKKVVPKWLKRWTILIFTCGMVIGVVSLIGMTLHVSVTMTKEDYIIVSRRLFTAVFSLLMAIYALEFMLNYCFRILENSSDSKID